MRVIIEIIVQVVHVLSFCLLMFVGVLGAVYEIIGHAKFEKILSLIGVSKGFERIWIVGIIMLLLFITTYFIKVKLFS